MRPDNPIANLVAIPADNVPIWVTGGSASTKTSINFAATYPPEGPLGFISFWSDTFDPDKAALVRQPTLVIVDAGDTSAHGGSLHGNNATFDYTVQLAGMGAPVHQQKQVTREIFTAPGTTCQ
jgi:hypothetical protein